MNAPHRLKMDLAVPDSLLDAGAQGVIGKGLDRVDGPLKVSGAATYAAEYDVPDLAYGFLVSAKFGRGRITGLDTDAAKAVPGVIEVVTDFAHFIRNPQQGGMTDPPTQGVAEVQYFGEIVAIVLAESFEAARDGAQRVIVEHEEKPGRFDFEALRGEAEPPKDGFAPARFSQGDVDVALAAAAATVDVTYTTPSQSSAAMEPHASLAVWKDGSLTVYGSYQLADYDRQQLAAALGLDKAQVRIVSRYVGGGFGSKLGIAPEAVAAAIAARRLGRPVKAVMARQQVFDATVRRSNTEQRVRLGTDADGRLTAIQHDTICSNLPDEDFFEAAGVATHFHYAGENRSINHDVVRIDWLLSGSMRAPGEAAGLLAFECAMDELAETLGIDPVELRKRNEPEQDPEKQVPFSSRGQIRCLDEGAVMFGWDKRDPKPAARREGEWLIGIGMASAARRNMMRPSAARVRLSPQGRATVETDMTDIGTGTYTILAQIAGELLGLPLSQVDVHLGDTDFPTGAGSGGSFGATSSGSSVYLACEALRAKLASALDCPPDALTLQDGFAIAANRRVPLGMLIGDGIEAEGKIEPGAQEKQTMQATYGAHFCEVAVHAVTGETRVRRMLGVFEAGRILNAKTARSQAIGGMTFGIGAALTEELVHDTRNGKVVNRDLAEYHIPVNADVPQIEAVFLEVRDPHVNPLHAKGLGELGICGAGAAIANAIYNACGVRVRDYPITLDKLLPGLPAL